MSLDEGHECVGREPTDPVAHLAAGLLLATWTARVEAPRVLNSGLELVGSGIGSVSVQELITGAGELLAV